MSIDKDIKQASFKSEHQKAMVNLIFTYNWTTEQLKQLFEEEGLTMQQFNILRILRGSTKPLSTLQIRERMLDKMSDSSRIVDRLVLKGLVKKITCKTDKRLVDVTITSKGLKLLEKLDAQEDKMENIFKSLSKIEAETLNTLLDKIRQSN
ncbi:MarR family transcriptional regulator [Ferruginibacter paludis]|uniref:MarR family winged helix-turn-helix transcriptional regulator n=1 Tax=Ferruginibacter TaxID=1004303 RepID=UPI0025B3CF36|nr:MULTISPECIES: MarR family transcriptional regulator [Ferruginibacter]MDB5278973.1 MarR family transcriptional regulator [Ferruginibacter sp.]MDN3658214.1 MarR family transcriptional regulator [Ferruginibacter paludis]